MALEKSNKSRLFYLLILLVALIILYPILKGSPFQGIVLNSVFTFILFSILYGMRGKRWIIYIG